MGHMSYCNEGAMKAYRLTDKEKLNKIMERTGVSRSELARRLQVGYKTVYRWLDKAIGPHTAQSNDIDQLFKEYVDLRSIVLELHKKAPEPIRLLKANKTLRDNFILEMTYESNAIEGSRMSVKETEMAFEGKKVRGKELFEILEAVNHKNALEFLLDNIKPDFKIDKSYILRLHEIVMYNFNNKLPGKYRTGHVNLTNTEKPLPSAQDVPLKMGAFIKNINNYGKDPIEKISRGHYEFEAIHPFFDGNGRSGRILMVLYLVLQKNLISPTLFISQYINNNKTEYYRLLREVTFKHNWKAWVLFILDAVEKQAIMTNKTILDILDLKAEFKRNILPKFTFAYTQELLSYIFSNAFYTQTQLINNTPIKTNKTAGEYLNTLEKEGILKVAESKTKEKVYYFENLLKALE